MEVRHAAAEQGRVVRESEGSESHCRQSNGLKTPGAWLNATLRPDSACQAGGGDEGRVSRDDGINAEIEPAT